MSTENVIILDGNSSIKSKNNEETAHISPNDRVTSALQRGMAVVQESTPELERTSEEIRQLDNQLDHMNDYMNKVEIRIRKHSEQLQQTLDSQRMEREQKRRSFQQRQQQSQDEDEDFRLKMALVLNRVDTARNRQSMYELISQMPIPDVREEDESHSKKDVGNDLSKKETEEGHFKEEEQRNEDGKVNFKKEKGKSYSKNVEQIHNGSDH